MSTRGVYFSMVTFSWIVSCLLVAPSVSLEVKKSYYDTLDVHKTATDRQIQKAFHKLAVRFHPDKNKSAEAETIFREIVEAYEVLSDQDTRRMYDHMGHEAFLQDEKEVVHDYEEHPEEAFFHFDFDDFFSGLDDAADDDDVDFLMDESHHSHWAFPMGSEDMEDLYEDQRILDNIFFDTHDHHYLYGYEDEEESEHFY